VAITRFLKRKGKVFIRIFPHKPVTARPPETRMGKKVRALPEILGRPIAAPGHMLFEISASIRPTAREALPTSRRHQAWAFGTRFVVRNAGHQFKLLD